MNNLKRYSTPAGALSEHPSGPLMLHCDHVWIAEKLRKRVADLEAVLQTVEVSLLSAEMPETIIDELRRTIAEIITKVPNRLSAAYSVVQVTKMHRQGSYPASKVDEAIAKLEALDAE